MTPQPQQKDDDILLITRKEFVEMANVHTDGISPARIMDISIRVAERSRRAPSPGMKEIHDQIGKLKTDLFKCIGTIESIQSKLRTINDKTVIGYAASVDDIIEPKCTGGEP